MIYYWKYADSQTCMKFNAPFSKLVDETTNREFKAAMVCLGLNKTRHEKDQRFKTRVKYYFCFRFGVVIRDPATGQAVNPPAESSSDEESNKVKELKEEVNKIKSLYIDLAAEQGGMKRRIGAVEEVQGAHGTEMKKIRRELQNTTITNDQNRDGIHNILEILNSRLPNVPAPPPSLEDSNRN